MGRNAILVLMLIERRDWNVAVDANSQVHDVVRHGGIVRGERETVPSERMPNARGILDVARQLDLPNWSGSR